MPWPRTNKFGIVENPIVFSPYKENNEVGGNTPPAANDFLLLVTPQFLLLDGSSFLLL